MSAGMCRRQSGSDCRGRFADASVVQKPAFGLAFYWAYATPVSHGVAWQNEKSPAQALGQATRHLAAEESGEMILQTGPHGRQTLACFIFVSRCNPALSHATARLMRNVDRRRVRANR
jgi:hypothetical protein